MASVWLWGSAETYASSTVDANIGVVMRGSGVADRPGWCGGLAPVLPVRASEAAAAHRKGRCASQPVGWLLIRARGLLAVEAGVIAHRYVLRIQVMRDGGRGQLIVCSESPGR